MPGILAPHPLTAWQGRGLNSWKYGNIITIGNPNKTKNFLNNLFKIKKFI